jgi:ubiquinone/menaquinone biosynthesis C-methylase UbiE
MMRRFKDLGITGANARWYDRNTRAHRLGEMRRYAGEVARRIPDGARVLEVAPGPGYLAIELARLGDYAVAGLDISPDFVRIARHNAEEAGVAVDFRQGNVAAMPFADATFDFIVCTAAFKNFHEPAAALAEMHRVLRPGGGVLIVDMNRDVTNREINALTREMGVKGAEGVFLRLTFKHFLRRGAYNQTEIRALAAASPFGACRIDVDGVGLMITLARNGGGAAQPSSDRASSGNMIGMPSRMG